MPQVSNMENCSSGCSIHSSHFAVRQQVLIEYFYYEQQPPKYTKPSWRNWARMILSISQYKNWDAFQNPNGIFKKRKSGHHGTLKAGSTNGCYRPFTFVPYIACKFHSSVLVWLYPTKMIDKSILQIKWSQSPISITNGSIQGTQLLLAVQISV